MIRKRGKMNERRPLLSKTTKKKPVFDNGQSKKRSSFEVILSCALLVVAIIVLSLSRQYRSSGSGHLNLFRTPYKTKTIRPGRIWYDTEGNPINAHAGGILHHGGLYWWYGEMKTGKTYLPKANAEWGGHRVDLVGIACYSSKDLLNWDYRGNVLPAVTDDPTHDLHTDRVAERPKVIYNKARRKFVMWLHIDVIDYSAALCGVAVSDRPDGPFRYLGSFRPDAGAWPINNESLSTTDEDREREMLVVARDFEGGQMARDLTLFVDDDDKAYLFTSSENNPTMHISQLSDDYLSTTGKFKRIFIGRYMEAPAILKKGGIYYFIGSGCTAWKPNAARLAVSEQSIWGPWVEKDNPFLGDNANTTFFSQPTYVLSMTGLGTDPHYIYMGDRWKGENLTDSRYVWLPMTFDQDKNPIIRWQDEFDPAAFLS